MDNNSRILDRFEKAQQALVLQQSDLSLGIASQLIDSQAIDLDPVYQRRPRWRAGKQSQLIESFLLNVPIPPIYLSEDEYGKYSIIDGKQRLTAISAFIKNELVLEGLETVKSLNGYTFNEIPGEIKNALSVRPYLRVITILKQSDPDLKYEVFYRLNTGGEPLVAQEVRNVAFRGILNDEIMTLCENKFLRQRLSIASNSGIVNTNSKAYREMQDAELVLRYLVLEYSWENFSGNFRRALDEYMEENRNSRSAASRARQSFSEAISACEKLWGPIAFSRVNNAKWRDQFISGVYDAQMVAVSELGIFADDVSRDQAIDAKAAMLKLFQNPAFTKACTQGTNTQTSVRFRVGSVINELKSIFN